MEQLNWGYRQLGLIALAFGVIQVWSITSVFWRRDLARPQSGGEFRKSLERIWKKEYSAPRTQSNVGRPANNGRA